MAINPNNPYASFGSNQFSPVPGTPRSDALRKLMDPTGFLSELAKLKEPTMGSAPAAKKKPQPAAVMQPPPDSTTPPATTTPPASTTPTTPAAPSPPRTNPPVYNGPAGVASTMWKDQSDAAKLTFAQDPLAPNAGNNLRRELGRIAAEESFARRDAESRARYRQANLDRAAAKAARPLPANTTQTAPAVKPVEPLAKLPMGTAPQMDFGNGTGEIGPRPTPNPLVITPDVPKLVESTPTGKLASIAAPAETGVGFGVTGQPPERWSPSPQQQQDALLKAIAARDEQALFTNPRVTMPTMDPLTAQAMADVDKRRAATQFDILPGILPSSAPDLRDPAVWKNYQEDVEKRRRELAGTGAQEVGAPRKLDSGGQPSTGAALLNTALSPFAPTVPQELRDKEIATAQSVGERDVAQAAQAQDQTRDALWVLLGGGAMANEAAQNNPDITNPSDPMLLERSRYRKAPTDLAPRQPGPTDLVAPDWRGPNGPLPPEQPIVTPANQGNFPKALPQGTSGGAYPLPPTALESLAMSSSEPAPVFTPSENPIGSPRNPADYRSSEITLGKRGEKAVSRHMIENPNAGTGIGVAQRRQRSVGKTPPTSPPPWVPSSSEPLPPVPLDVRLQNYIRRGLLNPGQSLADVIDYLAGGSTANPR